MEYNNFVHITQPTTKINNTRNEDVNVNTSPSAEGNINRLAYKTLCGRFPVYAMFCRQCFICDFFQCATGKKIGNYYCQKWALFRLVLRRTSSILLA